MSTTEQSAPPIDVPEIEPLPVAVTFASRGLYLTLERVHPRRVSDNAGNVHWTEAVDYEFVNGWLTVYPNKDVIADKFDPQTGNMEEQDALEWLRSHRDFNTDRGFWEVAPVAPDAAPLQATILQLAVRAGNPSTREDAENRLVGIHEAELGTWKRQPVLDACRAALAAIESDRVLSDPAPAPEPTAKRETLVAPPGFTRDADGVLTADNPDAIPHSSGPKPSDLSAGFNPPGGTEAPPE